MYIIYEIYDTYNICKIYESFETIIRLFYNVKLIQWVGMYINHIQYHLISLMVCILYSSVNIINNNIIELFRSLAYHIIEIMYGAIAIINN